MKITPYDPMLKPEKTLALKLVESPTGGTMVVACHPATGADIHHGIILTVAENGIVRHENVSPDLGLPLDGNGRVRVKDRRTLTARAAKVEKVLNSQCRGWSDEYVLYGQGMDIVTVGDLRHFLGQLK